MAWNPLDDNLLSSSVLSEGPDVVAVLALLIASADRCGESKLTVPYVASVMRISNERAAKAFEILSNPDPWSRNKEADGRRIEHTEEGTWRVVSHAKYRRLASKEMAVERQLKYMKNKKAAASKPPAICDEPGCGAEAIVASGGRSTCSVHSFDAAVREPGAEG